MASGFDKRPARAGLVWGGCVALGSAAALAGCVGKDPYAPPAFPFLSGYHGVDHGAPVLLQNDAWWARLDDAVLNRLIAQALQGSLSLEIARARIAEAQAAAAATPGLASLSPTLGVTGSAAMDQAPTGSGSAALTLNWLLDPYGAHRAEAQAALAGVDVAQAELASARLLLLYNLGNAYLDLRYRQTLLALGEQEMRGRKQTLAMTRTLLDAKDATRLDITRSQARVAELQARQPQLAAAVAAKKNEIAVLVGVAPGTLGISLDQRLGQPRPGLAPDVGIPADLLRNRPDILIAERRYYIALAGLTQAEAALYPRLSLTGAITLKAVESGRSGADYYFGPALQLPVLPGRSARAAVDQARARIAAAHGEWKSTVLAALLEVENALLDYRAASASLGAADKATRLYREALELTRQVFTQGDATLGDLIDAEQALASAEQAQAEMLYQRGLSFVALNIRLGAGHGVSSVTIPEK